MKTILKWGGAVLGGTLYAALAILLSRLVLGEAAVLAAWLCDMAGLTPELTAQIALAAGQLKAAVVVSPWIGGLVAGGLIGVLLRTIPGKQRLWITIGCGVLVLVPAVFLALCFTRVNDIRVLSVLRCALALL